MQETNILTAANDGDARAQFQLAINALSQGREDEFQNWIRQAAGQDFPPALFRYGLWRLLKSVEPREVAAARALVEKAADLGFLNAIRAMVVVSARGAGVLPDWQGALAWFKKALRMNDPRATREAAMLLLNGDDNTGVSRNLLVRAATAGDVIACYHLGLLEVESGTVGAGLFWLNHANQHGHVLAAKAMEPYQGQMVTTPEQTPPPLDWAEIEARLDQIKQPAASYDVRVMMESPRVKCIKGVLAKWECDYLIARSEPFLRPAMTVEAFAKGDTESDHRDNKVAKFWIAQQDIVVSMIERKVAHAGETPLDYAEDLSVLKYRPGEKNAPHYDSFLADVPEQVAQVRQGGQRIRTVLVYLNEDFEAGETLFVKPDVKIKCETGEALIFENMTPEGKPDLEALHAGLPPTSGIKWVISKWVRDKSQIVS